MPQCGQARSWPLASGRADRLAAASAVGGPAGSAGPAVATVAAQQGSRVLLSGHPRTLAATASVARGLGLPDPVTPLDVADADSLSALAPALKELGVTRLAGGQGCPQ